MDLPPPAQQRTPPLVHTRPNYSYFIFLSLLFYLLSSNHPSGSPLSFPPSSDSDSAFSRARNQLLLREARREGLARWVGASNTSGEWLNSTYFPDLTTDTANETTRVAVIPFEPSTEGEPKVLVDAVLRQLMHRDQEADGRIYAQNLTGFVKGNWEARRWSFADLGLNETWTTERQVEPAPGGDAAGSESPSNATTSEPVASLRRRQLDASSPSPSPSSPTPTASASPSLSPSSNVTLSSTHNLTTLTETHNRTLLRGSFPFLSPSPLSSPTRSLKPNKALFNLRSVQTSATGPVVFPPDEDETDDSQLLRVRLGDPSEWENWERKGPVVYVGGDLMLSIEDGESAGEETAMDIEAVHLLSSGLIYGYATPSFVRSHLIDTVSLPFFVDPDASTAPDSSENVTAHAVGRAMLKEIERRLKKDVDELAESTAVQESGLGGGSSLFLYAWLKTAAGTDSKDCTGASDPVPPTDPRCIFAFYGSLSPLPRTYSSSLYAEYYASLFLPSGSSLPPPPASTLSFVLSSQNCGLVLTGRGSLLPSPVIWTRVKDFALLMGLAQAVVVAMLVRQLEAVQRRPGTVANVASTCIGVGAITDSYVFVVLLTVGVVTTNRASLPLLVPAFLALCSSLVFGMRYYGLIRAAAPSPSPAPAPPPPPPPPTAAELAARAAERRATRAAGQGEEGEGEQREQAEEALAGSEREVVARGGVRLSRREKQILALVGALCVLIIWIVVRWGWLALLTLIFYSYWIPQLVLNVRRGTARQSLSPEFIIGTTLARLCLPVYFWGYEDNVLDVSTSPLVYVLVVYSLAQALLLILQSRLPSGARFFLPRRLLEELDLQPLSTWDYHRPLDADLEAGLGLPAPSPDYKDSPQEEGEGGGPDCPICLSPIVLHPSKPERDLPGAAERVRRAYALTPCRHVVHTECLESWMMVRAVCPVCRAGLPPLH
ncbi:hypothetical protein JCM5296_005843 [Sporobolomyces johnsonii]